MNSIWKLRWRVKQTDRNQYGNSQKKKVKKKLLFQEKRFCEAPLSEYISYDWKLNKKRTSQNKLNLGEIITNDHHKNSKKLSLTDAIKALTTISYSSTSEKKKRPKVQQLAFKSWSSRNNFNKLSGDGCLTGSVKKKITVKEDKPRWENYRIHVLLF